MRSGAFVFLLVLLLLPGWQAVRCQTLSTILSNGPTSNRINMVLLSEGYQTSELNQFLIDSTNAVRSILSTQPYKEYSNYFNAYAIAVASVQSGSDHYTPTTNLVNTYFNSTYDSFGLQRTISIPPNDRDANYSHGQGKVIALLQALVPEYDLAVLIVNDVQYGGSGGATLITSVNSSAPEIVVHESGHTFGGLTDEYTSAYPGWVPKEYPNATQQTNRASIKWNSWILPETPIPTPASFTTVDGLFLGAEYQTTDWYRPKFNCKMNHLGIPFCEICGEQLVKSIYNTIRGMEKFAPPLTAFSIATAQPVPFSVSLLQPATHSLGIQWFTNGTAVTGATNTSFSLLPQSLPNGTNKLQAQVRDATTLVRNDPMNLLSNSITWTLDVEILQLALTSPQWLGDGKFAFNISGTAPHGFVIEASTNLQTWLPVSTNFLVSGQFAYTNSGTDGFLCCYYRVNVRP